MQYHPELAVEYFSEKYDANYKDVGVIFNIFHLSHIYGLDVEIDPFCGIVINGGTFRGEPIDTRDARDLLDSNLRGGIYYGMRSGKFRKLWGQGCEEWQFTDDAFVYICEKLKCELLDAKLPLAPTKMLPNGCTADFIRELPPLPSPTALNSSLWPVNWQLDLTLTKRGEVNVVKCPSLDVALGFDFGHKRPHATDTGALRWWIFAAVVTWARSKQMSIGVAGEILKHAKAFGLSEEIQYEITLANL